MGKGGGGGGRKRERESWVKKEREGLVVGETDASWGEGKEREMEEKRRMMDDGKERWVGTGGRGWRGRERYR